MIISLTKLIFKKAPMLWMAYKKSKSGKIK